MESTTLQQDPVTPPHPRVLGWVGTAALAMGGSNQMIFLGYSGVDPLLAHKILYKFNELER